MMNYILSFVIVVALTLAIFILFHKPVKPHIDYIVFGKDTVIVKGAKVIDVSKVHSSKGHNDTLTGIFTTEILLNHMSDSAWLITDTSAYIYYDTTLTIHYCKDSIYINQQPKK